MPCNQDTIIILLLLFAKISISQIILPEFNHVRGTKDFTLRMVTGMMQDRYGGRRWFTDQTNGCLIRYDGYRITTYHHDPADSNSLQSGRLTARSLQLTINHWCRFKQKK